MSSHARRWDAIAVLALLVVGAAVTIAWGERIGVNGGEGWDGQAYVAWARDFPAEVFHRHITEYQSQRVLPSGVIYYALAALGIEHTREHVILAFQIGNACALVASAALLLRIAALLRWSRSATWAAVAAAFLSFASAKHALYYPTLTDPAAFALGTAAMWAYLERRFLAQWLVTMASVFTWPALLLSSFAALLFPRAIEPPEPVAARWARPVAWAVAAATAAVLTAWLVEEIVNPYEGTERALELSHHALWPLTIACVAVPGACAAYLVARDRRTWSARSYLAGVSRARLVAGALAVATAIVTRALWTSSVGEEVGMDVTGIQHMWASYALRAPLWHLVHHVVYFGPIVVLAILRWRAIASVAAAWGPGAVLALGVLVMNAVTTESRQLAHLMPFVIVIAIEATRERWTPARAAIFAGACFAWSKLWWHIGYDVPHNPYDWPDLRYTMQQGPQASDATFAAHAIAVAITAGLVAYLLRAAPSRTSSDNP